MSKSKIIFFNKDVTRKSVDQLIQKIIFQKNKNIFLYIDSDGGCIHSAFKFNDFVEKNPNNFIITTIGHGYVASSASILLLSGQHRHMTKRCKLLIHQLRQSELNGTYSDIKDNYKNCEKVHKEMIEFYMKKSTLTKNKIIHYMKNEREFDVNECLKYKLIDGVY